MTQLIGFTQTNWRLVFLRSLIISSKKEKPFLTRKAQHTTAWNKHMGPIFPWQNNLDY
jgi:hypothetical protein